MPSILITGVSSGIGGACAKRFDSAGWSVTGTVRDTGKTYDSLPGSVVLEQLDLAEPDSASQLAERVLSSSGCPDVLINNAGSLHFGPLETIPTEELVRLYQINVFGQLELARALIPAMRERGSGMIVNVTSLGGRMTFPFFGAYNSTKWALEGISEGLWHELRPFGIRVKAVEPGFVETSIWGKALPGPDEPIEGPEPYVPYLEAMREFEGSITNRSTSEQAADEIWRVVNDPSNRLRYPVAAYARPMIAARRLLGDRLTMRFFNRQWTKTAERR